jgi:hypothetical protein
LCDGTIQSDSQSKPESLNQGGIHEQVLASSIS